MVNSKRRVRLKKDTSTPRDDQGNRGSCIESATALCVQDKEVGEESKI
jgi:hypothetical protein